MTLVRIILAAVVPFTLGAVSADSELGRMQGQWTMASGQIDGVAVPPQTAKTSRRVQKGPALKITVAGQLYLEAKVTLDPSKDPRRIDYDLTAGRGAGKKQLGIYAWDGEKLKVCFGEPGGERPTDFTCPAGSGRTMNVWSKVP